MVLARDPATKVILCCFEACRDANRLVAALTEARDAGKPVIALKVGEWSAFSFHNVRLSKEWPILVGSKHFVEVRRRLMGEK